MNMNCTVELRRLKYSTNTMLDIYVMFNRYADSRDLHARISDAGDDSYLAVL